MYKGMFLFLALTTTFLTGTLVAHCQMPCGIYHDDMVYDQVDQYVETMYKGVSILNDNKRDSVRDRNEFIRWVALKEKASDETAQLIATYFLQQKIKPGEPDTAKRLTSAHKLMFYLVQIKQNCDLKFVENFANEWNDFKLMFHVDGYECKVEQLKMKKREELEKVQAEKQHTHDHDHDHEHEYYHEHSHR